MVDRAIVVLDAGKTLTKLTLWSPDGHLLERRVHINRHAQENGVAALDVAGIEQWVESVLREFADAGRVEAIIPVGHGAAAALIRGGQLVAAPRDYEHPIEPSVRAAYDAVRDPFAVTGSPALPDGLNLGAQLHDLEHAHPQLFDHSVRIVPWPQYWGWRFSGMPASEVSSLGCHSDLWQAVARRPSPMAQQRGWSEMLAPLRHARDVLGPITPEWVERAGLPDDVKIYCGLHDTNAALLAARGFDQIAGHDATVLSTGTWFVAMRTPSIETTIPLPDNRDCLINVDVDGRPIPSARFMGGREIEQLTGIDTHRIDLAADQPALIAAVPAVLACGAMVLPTFAPGCGPFPNSEGRWLAEPADPTERRAAVCLYAALVADAALDLIGARGQLLIEGRFADATLFVRALARLRPAMQVYVSNAHNDVSYGALRLIDPTLRPLGQLVAVDPLADDLQFYRARWQAAARIEEMA